MNPELRHSAAHVFVESVQRPVLSDADEHHLRRVLRVRGDDPITVCDGRGTWARARLGSAVERCGELRHDPVPRQARVVTAIPKGERLDWMVEKLVEVGATEIVLVDTARSVVRWDAAKRERQAQRLQAVVRSTASQCRRTWLPDLRLADTLRMWLATPGVVVADPGGVSAPVERPSTVVIGPEGGFAPDEVPTHIVRLALAETILRVETAAITAALWLNSH